MRVLDLFSGIGGFSLGLERAGMRTVAFCERDEFCRAVLRKHWPDVPCFDDIHAIDANGLDRLGRIDLVCGGFPCQPFSVAGDQKAHEDDRYLWPEMRRVIALARPYGVIGENVTGLIPLALDDVLSDLEDLGYAPRAFVIPACAVDAHHRRDRVWIIATDTQRIQLRDQSGRGCWARRKGQAEPRDDGETRLMADPNGSRLQRPGDECGATTDAQPRQSVIGRNGNGWVWDTEPDVGRMAHGVSARAHRIRALGNAVVPQIVEEIGRAMMQQFTSTPEQT